MWQDYALATMGIVFAGALFPSILSTDKPALGTSVLTCVGLTVNMAAFGSLGLWLSFASSAILFVLWGILGVQKYISKQTN